MKTISPVPNGLEEILETYGNPDRDDDGVCDPRWMASYLKVFVLPFPLKKSWKVQEFVGKIQLHKDVGEAVLEALEEIFKKVGVKQMRANKWDYWGGGWAWRMNVNAKTKRSTHSWGIAVDLNPHLCPNGEKVNNQPEVIFEAFKKRGFLWVPNDWMHAQACRGF